MSTGPAEMRAAAEVGWTIGKNSAKQHFLHIALKNLAPTSRSAALMYKRMAPLIQGGTSFPCAASTTLRPHRWKWWIARSSSRPMSQKPAPKKLLELVASCAFLSNEGDEPRLPEQCLLERNPEARALFATRDFDQRPTGNGVGVGRSIFKSRSATSATPSFKTVPIPNSIVKRSENGNVRLRWLLRRPSHKRRPSVWLHRRDVGERLHRPPDYEWITACGWPS
jgi:hypothetical protein